MGKKSMGYFKSLNKLFQETVDHLLGILRKYFNNGIEEVPSSIFNSKPRITEELTRLIIRNANGKRTGMDWWFALPGRARNSQQNLSARLISDAFFTQCWNCKVALSSNGRRNLIASIFWTSIFPMSGKDQYLSIDFAKLTLLDGGGLQATPFE